MNETQEIRSTEDISDAILNQGFKDKTTKYDQTAEDLNASFVTLIFLDNGEIIIAADIIKWLCFVAIPGSRSQKIIISGNWQMMLMIEC